MIATPPCAACGTPLRLDAPRGLCTECLMRLVEGPSPGQPPDDAPAWEPGSRATRFGDYELLRQIGREGMGVVYEARQTSLNRIVALKMILGGDLASGSAVRRFQVEAEAAAKLTHPHIVAVYEFGEHDGVPFFSMQRIDGTGLDRAMAAVTRPALDQIARNRSAAKTAARQAQVRIARLVATLARALQHAHQQGIIHCDLKPSNILIDREGQPHLTDFGIAHFLDREGLRTKSGIIGTPRYMAPEQATGRRADVTAATDIYGLGVILYELLTGQPPFPAATPHETLRQVMEEDPAAPHISRPLVHPDLSIICLKCLEKNPRHRYASAADLADDLERWMRHDPILARRPTLQEKLIRWSQRQPAIATLAASVALLLTTAAIGSALFAWNLARRVAERDAYEAIGRAYLNSELDHLWASLDKPSVPITAEKRLLLTGRRPKRPETYPGEELRLRFGVYTFEKPSVMARNFAPLIDKLEEHMAGHLDRPVRIDTTIYRSYTNGHQGLLSGEVHFMRVGPASYVAMKQMHPQLSLLMAETKRIHCAIFTRADSGITNLSQLRGQAFAFGDPESTFGTILAKVALFRAGLRAGDLSPASRHFRSHDEVGDAVKSNVCVAGSANIDIDAIKLKDWEIRQLHGFTNVLRMPYVAQAGLDPVVAGALERAFIAQKTFSAVMDQEYNSLREEIKEASQFDDRARRASGP